MLHNVQITTLLSAVYSIYWHIYVYFVVVCKRVFFLFAVKTESFYLEHYLHCFFTFSKWLKIAKIICIIIWFSECNSGVISQCNKPHRCQGKRKMRKWWGGSHSTHVFLYTWVFYQTICTVFEKKWLLYNKVVKTMSYEITRCLIEDLQAGN